MYPSSGPIVRTASYNRGYGFSVSGSTGTVAAALGANSLLFALKCGAQAAAIAADPRGAKSVVISRLRLAFTTIAAFTTPITPGRAIAVYRAANVGAEIASGTDLSATVAPKLSSGPASVVDVCRIGTVGGLTANGLVREAKPIATLDLVHVGNAGARQDLFLELAAPNGEPIQLLPTEYLVVSNPVAMDAGGTFQLTVNELTWLEARADDKGVG